MTFNIYKCLAIGLLQIQLITSQNRFCPEAVSSIQSVETCPTSKTEWDSAALKKNCSGLARRQNCVSVNKFKYHCVINGLRNKLVEVCAPERIIFGHCVEFNVRGGVIQDQKSALCNKTFPKCDRYYYSTNAFKYPDCYMLVSKGEAIWLTSAKHTTMRTITDESSSPETLIPIIAAILAIVFIAFLAPILIYRKRRMKSGMKMDESLEAMLGEIGMKHERRIKSATKMDESLEAMLGEIDINHERRMKSATKMNERLEAMLGEIDINHERRMKNATKMDESLEAMLEEIDIKHGKLRRASFLRRRFSTNDFSTYKTRVLTNHGRLRRNYSAGF